MTRLQRFDVFRAGVIGGQALGRYVATIEAPDHRAAKDAGDAMYGRGGVVVLPAGKTPPAAVTSRDRQANNVTHTYPPPRPRP